MQSEQINELAAALAKAQGSFDDVIKGKTAKIKQGFEYSYADLASVLQAVRKPLSENGLALAQLTHSENGTFWLESRLMHNSGQYITATWPLPAQGTPQQMGSALTYARRYTASALLGIASEDDDGAAGGDVKPSSGPPKVEQKDKPPFWRDERQQRSGATNGGGAGEADAADHWIHVWDANGNQQTFDRTQKGAAQAVSFLEDLVEEDAAAWVPNEKWAMEVHDKLGHLKDAAAGETKADMTLAERIEYMKADADQVNALNAG